MFDNIGGKIKSFATIICVLGMIASVVTAIVLWTQYSRYNDTITMGVGVLLGGCVASWIGCSLIYGFGQLIEDTSLIREALLRQGKQPAKEPVQPETKKAFIKTATNDISGWNCPHCKFFNSNAHHECTYCGNSKPAPKPRNEALTNAPRASWAGWTCAHCKFYNTSNPDKCTYCGKEK